VESISNANLEVYTETSTHKYSFEKTLSGSDSVVVNLESYSDDIVIILVPTGSAPASVEFKVAKYSAFPVWAIVLIVIACVICLGGIILVVVIVLVVKAKNRTAMNQGNRNAATSSQPKAAPTPVYQPYQQNQTQMGLDPYSNQNAIYNPQMQQPNQVQDSRPGYYSQNAPVPQPIAQPPANQPQMNQPAMMGQPSHPQQQTNPQPNLMYPGQPQNTAG